MPTQETVSTTESIECIRVRGARQNNLRNLDVDVPLHTLTVVTGVSGSGKSSFAFDTLYAEGQRRYIETFSSYARQFLDRMDKPSVDSIEGIPPAIAIQQANTVRTSRSTVGTMTEINDRLKLLYAKASVLVCPVCGSRVIAYTPTTVADALLASESPYRGERVEIVFRIEPHEGLTAKEVTPFLEQQGYRHIRALPDGWTEVIQDRMVATEDKRARMVEAVETAFRHGGRRVYVRVAGSRGSEPAEAREFSATLRCCGREFASCDANLFSFNSAAGACGQCHGFGRVIGISRALVIPDESLSVADGCIKPFMTATNKPCHDYLMRVAEKYHHHPHTPWRELSEADRRWYWEGDGSEDTWDGTHWSGISDFFRWMESRQYKMHVRVLLSRYREYNECPACHGTRLRPESTWWKVDFGEGELLDIHAFCLLPIGRALALIRRLGDSGRLDEAGKIALREVASRLEYLVAVGLEYLSLDRQSRTLSGGETQRIALTTALGSSLVHTLFVLDEPSIGLHPRDIARLNSVLARLRDAGNTLLIVEHDPDVIRSADHILELGPGPGEHGGSIVYQGPLKGLESCPASATGDYLAGRRIVGHDDPTKVDADAPAAAPARRASRRASAPKPAPTSTPTSTPMLTLTGVREHNLRDVTVTIPLGRLVVITGVSGSGKSTLVNDVLAPAVQRSLGRATDHCGAYTSLVGAEALGDIVIVDQSPIGKTTRSNPASYVGAFDAIRKVFARLPKAKELGFTVSDFSYNAGRGRCPSCAGTGFEIVEMQYLSDVTLRCEDCNGRRYRGEILDVTYPWEDRPLSIADTLELTVHEALRAFAVEPSVTTLLQPLADVGLGYLHLGQPVPTLSGGEAQRLKLADALANASAIASIPTKTATKTSKKTPKTPPKPTLFLLDEPTTGLHFEDISTLLRVLRRLQSAGHSLIVIEHNLDFMAHADYIIDLGPEGGDAGGTIMATGTPATLATTPTHTGRALADYFQALGARCEERVMC